MDCTLPTSRTVRVNYVNLACETTAKIRMQLRVETSN